MGREYCLNFYKRINSSVCMELNWGEENMPQTQVCPVSNECEDLKGGREYHGKPRCAPSPTNVRTSREA